MATMIRINLLPTKAARKADDARQFLIVGAAVLVVSALANFGWYWWRDSVRATHEQQVAGLNDRIRKLEAQIGEVNNIKTKSEEVKKKLAELEKLKKKRTGPVRMMDALASSMPKKVWLNELDEKGGAVKVVGTAASYEDVADLMKALASVVWTKQGIGRVIEKKRDATTVRVELLEAEGQLQEFNLAEVGYFFTNIDLKRTEAGSLDTTVGRSVKFELTLNASYTI